MNSRLPIVLAVASVAFAVSVQAADKEAFKKSMAPKVGKKVTVSGKLAVGKLGDFVATDDGGSVYLLATKPEDISEEFKILNPLNGKRITVTGILHYRPFVAAPKLEKPVSSIPEHFYIDVMIATIEHTLTKER